MAMTMEPGNLFLRRLEECMRLELQEAEDAIIQEAKDKLERKARELTAKFAMTLSEHYDVVRSHNKLVITVKFNADN